MSFRNIKLTIQYDGSDYHGWQIQPGQSTIQETIKNAVEGLFGDEVRLFGASRTDAGVSALGQVGLMQVDSPIPTENLAKAITDRLPGDIAVTEAAEVPAGFDITGDVKSKLYRYTIFTGPTRPVLQIKHCWHIPAKLDIDAMDKAAKFLVGKHNFKSFASAADKRESSIRTIFRCDVCSSCVSRIAYCVSRDERRATSDETIYIDVEGDGFLYNMVRNIVGSLVEVGVSRWKPEKVKDALDALDRTAAGPIAPAAGLCLMWIKY